MIEKQEYYRFQMFVTKNLSDVGSKKIVGASYLREGQKVYTVRLWMFPEARFFLMPDEHNPARMLLMTREPKKNPNVGKGKYFWNLVGSGFVDVSKDVVRLEFDLIDRPIYMSIFPSQSNQTGDLGLSEVLDAS